jgi:excisionase family DNA binding protein
MKKPQDAREKGRQESDGVLPLTPKLLLSVPEAADVLGVSKRTVYLLLASGDLARKKVRRRTMIHREDVIRFAAQASAFGPEANPRG